MTNHKKRAPQRCSTCRRLRRGHVGPTGPKCNMSHGDTDSVNTGSPSKKFVKPRDNESDSVTDDHTEVKNIATPKSKPATKLPIVDPFLNELAAQLGQMNLNIQELAKDNRSMKADIATCIAGSRSIAVEAAPSWPRPRPCEEPPNSRYAGWTPQPLGNHDAHFPGTSQTYYANGPETPVCLMNGARVTRKVTVAAKAGEYAELLNFVPNNEPSNVIETVVDDASGQVVFRQKSTKKAIDCFLSWSQAWAGYEELLIEHNPHLYLKCASYKLFIQKHDALYTWTAVTLYDQRFRHKLSMNHSFDFEIVDTNIAFLVFNSLSVRPNHKGCFRCGSLDHHQKSCPFSTGGPLEKAAQTPKRQSKPGYGAPPQGSGASSSNYSYSRAKEICFNFNSGKCPDAAACGRRHVCSGCGGPDPYFRCFRCNPAPNHTSLPSQPSSMGTPSSAPSR